MKGKAESMDVSSKHASPEILHKLKDKKTLVMIGCGVLGIILLLFSVIGDKPEKSTAQEATTDTQALCDITEKRLVQMLEGVKGAGKTDVMITFDTVERYVYAADSESENDDSSSSKKSEYIIISNGDDGEGGLISTVYLPSVRGVAVVCEGGASASVREEVTRLVCAVLGISSAKVYVSEKVSK